MGRVRGETFSMGNVRSERFSLILPRQSCCASLLASRLPLVLLFLHSALLLVHRLLDKLQTLLKDPRERRGLRMARKFKSASLRQGRGLVSCPKACFCS